MNLRIISGGLKGRRIFLPERQVTFRPTKDRVRQSLAEIVKEKIPGAVAADFCAGSGAFGIELVSRGAALVHFVERDRVLAGRISDCASALGVMERCRVFERDVRVFVRDCPFTYDIIFYDPPYENEALAALAGEMVPLLSKDGILLYEYSTQRKKAPRMSVFPGSDRIVVETKTYGDTAVDMVGLTI